MTSPDKVLVMTVGLPRSGKSTWARGQAHPTVSPDAIRLALTGQEFFGPAEPMVWGIAKTMVLALFNAGHSTVILDSTSITRERRSDWISSVWLRTYIIFVAGATLCKGRATATGKDFLHPVIDRMDRNRDEVHEDEYDIEGDANDPILL